MTSKRDAYVMDVIEKRQVARLERSIVRPLRVFTFLVAIPGGANPQGVFCDETLTKDFVKATRTVGARLQGEERSVVLSEVRRAAYALWRESGQKPTLILPGRYGGIVELTAQPEEIEAYYLRFATKRRRDHLDRLMARAQ